MRVEIDAGAVVRDDDAPAAADAARHGRQRRADDVIEHAPRSEADEFYADDPSEERADRGRTQRPAPGVRRHALDRSRATSSTSTSGSTATIPRSAAASSASAAATRRWRHLNSMRILSMPDKWEYPWFAAWDLAFHAVVFALIDAQFAKEQLWLMLFEQFQHPNGQIPAYEWEFSDLNPPVHAWAVWRVYNMDRIRNGAADREFLEKCFHKLLLNFTWWVNKVDREGNNVFEGGFLGLDNITVFDRSDTLPGGASLEQSDATGWMGMFSPGDDAHRARAGARRTRRTKGWPRNSSSTTSTSARR